MHWLPLAFAMEFCFGQAFKWTQRRGHYAPVVITTNYLLLSALLALYYLSQGQLTIGGRTALLGLVTGTVFITAMGTMTYALTQVRASAVLTGFRLSLIVPPPPRHYSGASPSPPPRPSARCWRWAPWY